MASKLGAWISKAVRWLYRYSGAASIVRKFNPSDGLPTGPLWVVGIYVALFSIASQRYENRIDIIENRANSIYAQLGTTARKKALGRIARVQRMKAPVRPQFSDIASPFVSLVVDTTYQAMVNQLRDTVEDRKAELDSVNLFRADLRGADLSKAHLSQADLREADLFKADLSEAVLSGANLFKADLFEANLRGAHLRDAHLSWAHLRGADLRGTLLLKGDLFKVNLRGADLREADLSKADLREADLSLAVMRGAILRGAHLFKADLFKVNLRGADLRGADLSRAFLREADLNGSHLYEAHLLKTDLRGADLRGVRGLSAAQLCESLSLWQARMDTTQRAEAEKQCPETLVGRP